MDVLNDDIRKNYIAASLDENDTATVASLIKKKETDPILTPRHIEPEDTPIYKSVVSSATESFLDLKNLNDNLVDSALEYENLRNAVDERVGEIRKKLDYQRELVKDTHMIRGSFSEFTGVKPLNASVTAGKYFVEEDGVTFSCYKKGTKQLSYSIYEITGNGNEGNTRVKAPSGEGVSKIDTSNRDFVSDKDKTTAWEYERLETDDDSITVPDIHHATDCVRCRMTLYTESQATRIKIHSKDKHLILEDVEVSVDGESYTHAIGKSIYFNDPDYLYNDYLYIYGSGIIGFSPSNYIRLTFRSDINTADVIVDDKDESMPVKRKVISIGNIALSNDTYDVSELISEPIVKAGTLDCIALYANVYIPRNISATVTPIRAYFVINGTEIPVVPINSQYAGTRIIRHNNSPVYKSLYCAYIHAPISSARLKIKMTPYMGIQTPYLSRIKICYGKNTGVKGGRGVV